MDILGLLHRPPRTPRLLPTQKITMLPPPFPHLPRQKQIRPVGQHHRALAIQRIHDVHVVLSIPLLVDAGSHAREFLRRRRHEHQGRAERGVEPVGGREGDGVLLGQQEELVRRLQQGGVGVEAEHARVLGLVESVQFRQALRPGGVGRCGCGGAEGGDGGGFGAVLRAGLGEEGGRGGGRGGELGGVEDQDVRFGA